MDNLFGSSQESVEEINQTDIEREVYGRDEDDFSFDIDVNTTDICEVLKEFREETWEGLSEEEKLCAISEFGKLVAELLDISNLPSIL